MLCRWYTIRQQSAPDNGYRTSGWGVPSAASKQGVKRWVLAHRQESGAPGLSKAEVGA
jgi:hypothetical protein